jgi:hypothetical protein
MQSERFRHPKTILAVDIKGNGVRQIRFGGEQLRLESRGQLKALDRFLAFIGGGSDFRWKDSCFARVIRGMI